MNDIRLIAAVGQNGELGLKGELPWGPLFPEDRQRFRETTAGDVVVVGGRTWPTVMSLQGTKDRTFLCDYPKVSCEQFLDAFDFEGRTIWIAGGAFTFLRWLPMIQRFDVTRLPWSGEADVFMPDEVMRAIPQESHAAPVYA